MVANHYWELHQLCLSPQRGHPPNSMLNFRGTQKCKISTCFQVPLKLSVTAHSLNVQSQDKTKYRYIFAEHVIKI